MLSGKLFARNSRETFSLIPVSRLKLRHAAGPGLINCVYPALKMSASARKMCAACLAGGPHAHCVVSFGHFPLPPSLPLQDLHSPPSSPPPLSLVYFYLLSYAFSLCFPVFVCLLISSPRSSLLVFPFSTSFSISSCFPPSFSSLSPFPPNFLYFPLISLFFLFFLSFPLSPLPLPCSIIPLPPFNPAPELSPLASVNHKFVPYLFLIPQLFSSFSLIFPLFPNYLSFPLLPLSYPLIPFLHPLAPSCSLLHLSCALLHPLVPSSPLLLPFSPL